MYHFEIASDQVNHLPGLMQSPGPRTKLGSVILHCVQNQSPYLCPPVVILRYAQNDKGKWVLMLKPESTLHQPCPQAKFTLTLRQSLGIMGCCLSGQQLRKE